MLRVGDQSDVFRFDEGGKQANLFGHSTDAFRFGGAPDPKAKVDVIATSGDAVTIPDAHFLFSADFKRKGQDLVLTGEDDRKVIVQDYFSADKRATLYSPNGASLTGEVIELLAGPEIPGQFAQAGAAAAASAAAKPIGRVERVTGTATVTRTNGVTVELKTGDVVFRGDVVQTGRDSTVGISLADGTIFDLFSNARMTLNEFVYDPNGTSNSALLSLVQGSVGFLAGKLAKSGEMLVETPVATMGIRGTATLTEIVAVDGTTSFSVLTEPDQTVGTYNLYEKVTRTLLATVDQAGVLTLVGPAQLGQAPAVQQQQMNLAQLQYAQQVVQELFQIFTQFQANPFNPDQSGVNPRSGPGGGSGSLNPFLDPIIQFNDAPTGPLTDFQLAGTVLVTVTRPGGGQEEIQFFFDATLVVGAVIGTGIEDGATVPLNALGNISGLGPGITLSIVPPAALPAGVTFDDTTNLFTIDPTDDAFDHLGVGQVQVVTVSYGITDGTTVVPASVSWTIVGVNDAPVLTPVGPQLAAVNEDAVANAGQTVASFLAGVTDIDSGALQGIAITATDDGNGHWEYSLNGVVWIPVGAVSDDAALLLRGSDFIRFVPNGLDGTAASITYRAWDQSSGAAGTKVDTGPANGDDTAPFSEGEDTASIAVTAVNDAPAGTDKAVTIAEDSAYTFTVDDFGFSDPNDNPTDALQAVVITSLPTDGTLKLHGLAVTAGQSVAVADINAGKLKFFADDDEHGTPYASFTFQVQDDGGTDNGGVDLDPTANTFTFNINAVNDAPEGTDNTVATDEDTPYVFTTGNFGFSDPEDAPGNAFLEIKIAGLPTNGKLKLDGQHVDAGDFISVADITAGKLTFVPDADEKGANYATFTFQVRDDGGTANGGVDLDQSPNSMTIDVGSVNDPPAGTNKTVNVNEDATYTFTVADFGFTDPLDDPDNTFVSVIVTTSPGAGVLRNGAANVTSGTLVSVADIMAGNLKFTPAPDANGAGYASFTFQVQDDGGGANTDPTPNTMTINVAAVNDVPVAGVGVATVSEEGLPNGSPDGAGNPTDVTNSATAGGQIAVSDVDGNPLSVTLGIPATALTSGGQPVVWSTTDGGHTLLGKVGATEIVRVNIDNAGNYAVTLSKPIDHPAGDGENLKSFIVPVSVADGAAITPTTLTVTIEDDSPRASPSMNDAFESAGINTNLMLIIDLSGSMDEASGVTGMSRLDLLKASVAELLEQYDNLGNVAVRIVTFSSNGSQLGGAWLSLDQARTIINGLDAGGATDYDAALATAQAAFGTASGKIAGAQSMSYFFSDGEPTEGGGINGGEVTAWQNFLNANDINSFAIGVGSGVNVSTLNPIAYDGRGNGTNTNGVVVTDLSQLPAALIGTVAPINGGVLGVTDSTFGADGGFVRSIKFGARTYTFDGTNTVTDDNGGGLDNASFNAATHVLTIVSEADGTLAIDMDDAAYTFVAPVSVPATKNVQYEYTLIDKDGDTAVNTLTITVNNVDKPPMVRDDTVITNISGGNGTNIVIPDAALLFNDTDPDGQAISVTAVGSATSGSIADAPAGSVTFTDNNSGGGTFMYTGSTVSPAASNTGLVTIDRSQAGQSQLDGTGLGDILIGRNNAADTIRANGGDDFLSGGSGNDALWGGTGRDAFHFGPNFGHDTLFDFVAGTDLIVIDDSIFANFAEVLDHAANDGQGNTIIAVDAANSITLNNVIKANLSVADFHFV